MKVKNNVPKKTGKINEPIKTTPETAEVAPSASGRWSSSQRIRLPHRMGLPLSSGGGGDGVSQ